MFRGDGRMYLTELHIENFRLLKNVDIKIDQSLTLFVGKNNTGKTVETGDPTSIGELLFMLIGSLGISFYFLKKRMS